MKFEIQFTTRRFGSLFEGFMPGDGMEVVEIGRELCGYPKLPASKFHQPSCPSSKSSLTIDLFDEDEKFIKQIPQFEIGTMLTVEVPIGAFDKYLDLKTEVKWEFRDGFSTYLAAMFGRVFYKLKMIKYVSMWYGYKEDDILKDWIAEGCQLSWGITPEEMQKQWDDKKKKQEDEKAERKQREAEDEAFEEAQRDKEKEELRKRTSERRETEVLFLEDLQEDVKFLKERLDKYVDFIERE